MRAAVVATATIATISTIAILAGPLSSGAMAQDFPAKPIRLIVPYPPGGMDPIARPIISTMSSTIGQPIVLENRAGANGMIGSEYVARNPADGYTLLFGSISTHVTPIFLSKTLPYDPVKDFTPISMVADAMFFVSVQAKKIGRAHV